MGGRRRVLVMLGVTAALWLLAFFVALPALVRGAHAGESIFPWLNRVIEGQSQQPISYYQSLARRAALLASAGALLSVLAGVAAWRWRMRIAAAWRRLVYAKPAIGAVDLIASGAWCGFLAGVVEATSLIVRFSSDPVEAPAWQLLWMAPLAAACMGAVVIALVALALRATRGGVSIAVPVVLISSFAIFGIVAGLRMGIHQYAIMLLSAGVAIALGRLARRWPTGFTRVCRRSLPWMGGAAVTGALALSAIAGLRERQGERLRGTAVAGAPNVLFLILDTVRAQDLSLYGYERQTSPEIDRFASSGVTFDRAIAPAPWTLSSHASMFTGAAPDRLAADFHAPLDAVAPTIAEVLRAHGYATGGFVANLSYTTRASGLDRGFSTYRDHRVSAGLFLSSTFWLRKAAQAIRPALGMHGALVRKPAAEVNREFLSWLPTDGKPFFAFLNYFDAHTPYKLERPFDRKFGDRPPRYWQFEPWGRSYSDAELAEFRESYNSAIASVDARVGELLGELKRRGVLRNTLVILTSDHGEHLGEHGGITGHGNTLYLPLLHVPLVISYPSHVPAGARVERTVSLQDIPATILELLGVAGDPSLPGESLARYWNPEASDIAPSGTSAGAAFSQLTFNSFARPNDPIRNGTMQSLMDERFHYIRNGDGREELYDYLADADERTNLAEGAESASLLASFRERLAQRASPKRTSRNNNR
jgi:arylsulfatase A-like enzyme